MQDHHSFPAPMGRQPGGNRRGGGDGLADVARWALGLLAARRAVEVPRLRPDLFRQFYAASVDPDESRLGACLALMVRERVAAAAVADLYIPEMARLLGEDWIEDRLSFVQVSLAAARMQAMLRAIGCTWAADTAAPGAARALILTVPAREQHTLGALVLLGQLRRLGITVRLVLGPVRHEIPRLLRQGGMTGVLISVAGTARLADAAELVKEIRQEGPPGVPVVLGGAVLLSDRDAVGALGADLVTSDLRAALAVCGMTIGAERAQLRA